MSRASWHDVVGATPGADSWAVSEIDRMAGVEVDESARCPSCGRPMLVFRVGALGEVHHCCCRDREAESEARREPEGIPVAFAGVPPDPEWNRVIGPKGLMVMGPTGSGKTWLLAQIARSWDRGRAVMTTEAALIGAVRRGDAASPRCCPLLLVDNLGEGIARRAGETAGVIQARKDAGLPTVLASALPERTLVERLGKETVERIAACCEVVRLEARR